MNEFELIDRYFRNCGAARPDVRLGVGDDAALLACAPGHDLVAAIDTLVEGRHFPPGSPAASVGHRAVAVNLSDLAAMGATPSWALLALTVPRSDPEWLAGFAGGLARIARQHNLALVGGDTTAGPLCVTIQVLGQMPANSAMRRSGASAGDVLFVSGTPGDAAAGLALEQAGATTAKAPAGDARSAQRKPDAARYLRERFLYPTPRVDLGVRLRKFASACIDVSDGLFGDAGKLAAASCCGVRLSYEELPVSAQLIEVCGDEAARHFALTGGDDYELCFSVPPGALEELEATLPALKFGYRRIGVLTATAGLTLLRAGIVTPFSHSGFDHFAA